MKLSVILMIRLSNCSALKSDTIPLTEVVLIILKKGLRGFFTIYVNRSVENPKKLEQFSI